MIKDTTKFLLPLFLIALFHSLAHASMEAAGGSSRIDLAVVISGGGATISDSSDAKFTAIGENNIYITLLSSLNNLTYTGQAYLLVSLLSNEQFPQRLLISNLLAFAGALGSPIAQKTWQTYNEPYFSWQIDVVPTQLLRGFAVSLDVFPNTNDITTDAPDYQFTEAIPSGKHTFYVLPFTFDKGAEQASLLSFDIWIDKDAPSVSQMSPASGAILTSASTPVSCVVSDADSGIDLGSTSLTINSSTEAFNYDAGTMILTTKPGTVLSEGKNSVMLKAYDNVGNYVTKAWDFILDTVPPQGTILINGGQQTTHSAFVTINVKAFDETTQIQSVYLSNDGVFDTEMNHPLSYSPEIAGWLLAQPDTDGDKVVYAKFKDGAGNLSQACTAHIILKRLTPDTRIISGPSTVSQDTGADFKYDASKPGCLFSYKLDNGDWSGWSTQNNTHFEGLSPGNHYFYAKAGFDLNNDGNISIDEEDATPAQWVWAVQPQGYLEKLEKRILFWRR